MPQHGPGPQNPHKKRQSLCRHQTALTLIDVGVAALCPGRKAKSVAAIFLWFFEHPDSNASRWSRFHSGVMLMPLINYAEPMSFPEAVEAVAIILQRCLVKLRDEAAYREDHHHEALAAAHFLIDMLEDALKESETLAATLEAHLTHHQ